MSPSPVTHSISMPSGYHLEAFDELDSTNSEALRQAEKTALDKLWIWARNQTAGRGRQGRPWLTSNNDLTSSLLLSLDKPPAQCAQLTFVTALAVRDTLASFDPKAKLTLKWPNDVLLGGKKVSGILLESHSATSSQSTKLVIGTGINISSFPEDTPFPATCLGAHMSMAPSRNDVLQTLVRAFSDWFETWERDGFSIVRAAWLDHAHGIGTQIKVKLKNETLSGMFNSLTDTGALDLKLTTGEHRAVSAGEVFFDYPL